MFAKIRILLNKKNKLNEQEMWMIKFVFWTVQQNILQMLVVHCSMVKTSNGLVYFL